jgi:hypothetical protein
MLPRTRSHRITVGQGRFRYIVAECGRAQGTSLPLAITVQHEKNGARLRVVGLSTCRVPAELSRCRAGRTVFPNIEPRQVAQLIKLAILKGWKPASPGPAFILQAGNAALFVSETTSPRAN